MQHNVDGRRRKKRQVVNNVRPRSYHDQRLQQPVVSAPLLSRIRNFNNLALSSIGSFFSGSTITKATAHLQQDKENISGRISVDFLRNQSNAHAHRGSDCLWVESPQSCLFSPENDDLTSVGNGYYSREAVYSSSFEHFSSPRLLRTDSSDSNVFPSDASVHTKNELPLVQRASSFHTHTLLCRPDTLDGNDIRDTYILAERLNLHDPCQTPLQLNSSTTAEYATNATLSATAAIFVPSSAATRALLSCNKALMASFQTNFTELDTAFVDTETPPLTPDSSKTRLLSPASFSTSFEHVVPSYSYSACTLDSSNRMTGEFRVEGDDDDKILYASPQLLEVKEGKKREQLFVQQSNYDPSLRSLGPIVGTSDDAEEWYGLEYTLALSSRERQPSDIQSSSLGEHSKSRESWAAIHRGTIHPFFEDEDYYQWKNWHHLLDKQDERRKHKKGFAFKAHSKELSCLFVDEMKTRDILYWQKGVYGVVAREVNERLNYITARCPDPYFPPKKHNLGWYLKRSRTVACIRELKAIGKAENRVAAGKEI